MSLKKPIPILKPTDTPSWLTQTKRPFHDEMFAFYSSDFGGIITDPLYMNVPIDDHLTHRGDGVFETLKCIDGRIYCFQEHLDRLFTSAEKIGLQSPWGKERVGEVVCATIRAANNQDCLVRLILSRGPGSMGINPDDSPKPSLYALVHQAHAPFMQNHPDGARIITSGLPVKAGEFATIKSCNYLPNALLKKEAVTAGVDFAIGFDENGNVAEGATENIGILTSGQILTVPKPGRILNGTTMNRILDLANQGIVEGWLTGIERRDISPDELTAADEVYIFGTTTDVTSVTEINGTKIGDGSPGPVYKKLSDILLSEQRSDNEHTCRAFS